MCGHSAGRLEAAANAGMGAVESKAAVHLYNLDAASYHVGPQCPDWLHAPILEGAMSPLVV